MNTKNRADAVIIDIWVAICRFLYYISAWSSSQNKK